MAGKYTYQEIASFADFVNTLKDIGEITSDPKKLKDFLRETENAQDLANTKKELLAIRDETAKETQANIQFKIDYDKKTDELDALQLGIDNQRIELNDDIAAFKAEKEAFKLEKAEVASLAEEAQKVKSQAVATVNKNNKITEELEAELSEVKSQKAEYETLLDEWNEKVKSIKAVK